MELSSNHPTLQHALPPVFADAPIARPWSPRVWPVLHYADGSPSYVWHKPMTPGEARAFAASLSGGLRVPVTVELVGEPAIDLMELS